MGWTELLADGEQVIAVGTVMPLEVGAQVKEWFGEQVVLEEHEGDEQTPYAAVAVEEGMDGLELVVDEGDLQ